MRLAVLGGTFDPVHNAHIQMAKAAADEFALDKVLFVPTGHPPHKLCPMATGSARLALLNLAVGCDGRFEACDIEVNREGTTYTVDTLRALGRKYPDARIFYIIGEDTLAVLDSWREFGEVARRCEFLVFGRGGDAERTMKGQALLEGMGARIHRARAPVQDVSSSQARLLAAGQDEELFNAVPEAVGREVMRLGVYKYARTREDVYLHIRATLSPKRFRHTLGVEHEAASLAMRHGEDHVAASLAALLHDCAKELPGDEIIRLALSDGQGADEAERSSPFLLHGRAGAALAADMFGLADGRALDAVRWHVTGRVGMTPLEMILYIADMTDPGRPLDNAELRQLARQDLRAACRLALAQSITHIVGRGRMLYPRTVYSYNSLIGEDL